MSVLTPDEALNKARCLGIVEGKVTRFIESKDNGKRWGFELAETIKAQTGASWERNWTVWSDSTAINLDDHIIVTGEVSFKYEEYAGQDGSQRGKVSPNINKPYIQQAFTKPVETESLPF